MGIMNNWFLIAVIGMLSFAGMALTLKKLTYSLPTPLILLYLFVVTSLIYLGYNLKWGESLKIGWAPFLAYSPGKCILAFIGNICDVEALRLAPSAGYASAVKSGQILVITVVALSSFQRSADFLARRFRRHNDFCRYHLTCDAEITNTVGRLQGLKMLRLIVAGVVSRQRQELNTIGGVCV